MSLKEKYEPKIRQALDDITQALARHDVTAVDLKISQIPDKIREIQLNKYTLTINCSEFDSGTIQATKDGKTRTGTVAGGQCIIKLPSTGTWHIEHDLGDYVETEVNAETASCELVKKKVTFSEGECTEEKIVVHIDSVVGQNSNDNFIRVKKNGVTIEVQAQLKGSDIEITNFEYEEGVTYTVEYVIKDEVRGSVEVEIANNEDYIVDGSTSIFEDLFTKGYFGNFTDFPTHIVFTDEKAPDNVQTYNWSNNDSNGVIRWLDSEKNTLYISTQQKGQKIIINELKAYPFANTPGLSENENTKTETIDLKNIDTSNLTSVRSMFDNCLALIEIKNIENLNTENVTDFDSMFENCNALLSLDTSNFKTHQAKTANYMFVGCASLKTLDLSNFEITNLKASYSMFNGCKQLTTIYAQEWANNNSVSSSSNMFFNCSQLPNYNSDQTGISMAKWKENGGYFTNPAEKPS